MMLDVLYRDIVTVFNRIETENRDIWVPHVLDGVHLVEDRATMVSTYGDYATDNAMLNIRYTGGRNTPTIGKLKYISPFEFKKLTRSEAKGFITFSHGDNFDFFMAGKWPELGDYFEAVSDDEYGQFGGFFTYMTRNYDAVYAISSCSKYNYLPHFTVTGK